MANGPVAGAGAASRATRHYESAERYVKRGEVAKAIAHFGRAREYDALSKARFGVAESSGPQLVSLDSKEGDRLLDASGSVKIVYDGVEVPCAITRTASEMQVRVAGDSDCLNFSVYMGKNQSVIYILEVATITCPLPDMPSKGRFLLRFVDEICRQIGIRTVTLTDASTIPCGAASVDLQFLSFIRYGQSWYERQGFSYQSTSKRHNISAIAGSSISAICKFLLALDAEQQSRLKQKWLAEDITAFKDSFPQFSNEAYAASASKKPTTEMSLKERLFLRVLTADYGFSDLTAKVTRMCALAAQYKSNSNSDTLGVFLVRVWSPSTCADYVDVMSVLYPSIPPARDGGARGYIDPSILPRYVRGDTSMIKQLW